MVKLSFGVLGVLVVKLGGWGTSNPDALNMVPVALHVFLERGHGAPPLGAADSAVEIGEFGGPRNAMGWTILGEQGDGHRW